MEIIDFYANDNKDHWLSEINKSDWRAGKYLFELLRDQKLKELCGESTKALLLIDGDKLISFCTYAEQDVYVFGADQPLETYTGKVIAVYHRLNDNEDKWIVSLSGEMIQAEDILEAISFQEQYFMGELYTL